MKRSRAGFFFGVILVFDLACNQKEEECSGCSAPHSITYHSGGTDTSVSGVFSVPYEAKTLDLGCSDSAAKCAWTGNRIVVSADGPESWVADDRDGGDAGDGGIADASRDAEDAASDGDAGGDAEPRDAAVDAESDGGDVEVFADAATGAPRGWGANTVILGVDLGATPSEASTPLVSARVLWCDDRYETLVWRADGGALCQSAGERPARVDALAGTLTRSMTVSGETTTTTMSLRGATAGGLEVSVTSTTTSAPYRSTPGIDCY